MSTGGAPQVVSDAAHERSARDYLNNVNRPTTGVRAYEAFMREIDEIDPSYRS